MRRLNRESGMSHVAGIIPVAGQPLDFNFPWHDCMQPIAQNFLAIERAVLECATAGCKTIWIICPTNMQPLLKRRLGEYLHDPVTMSLPKQVRMPSTKLRPIPIYYIPAHPKDKRKRDSLVWSALYGIKLVRYISSTLSKWLIPSRYYIAFPYGVFPSQYVRKYRYEITHSERFFVSFKGKTIRDGEYLSCCVSFEDVKKMRKIFRDKATGLKKVIDNCVSSLDNLEIIPHDERYSGRFLTIKDIFENLDSEGFTMEVPWYHNISTWEGLCGYLSSEDRTKMRRPIRKMIIPKSFWNGLNNYDDDIETT